MRIKADTIRMNGHSLLLRNASEDDAEILIEGLKTACSETRFLDGEYAGNCSLTGMEPVRYKHRASMGIALLQKYTGMGVGRVMIEKLISAAKEIGIEQIELEVIADNDRAISLYKKMGFDIWGTFPRNMKYKDGTYADACWMMKQV